MKMGYAWQEALAALDEPGETGSHPIYRVRQWQIGAALYLAGNVLQFLSYAFAAQSLLLALSSAQFGTHLLFAWLMEGVNVPFRSMLGAGIIISFNILLVVFSSKSSQLMTARELLELFKCALPSGHVLLCHLLALS
jgi:magnesium transporter